MSAEALEAALGALDSGAKHIEEELANLVPAFLYVEVRSPYSECKIAIAMVRRAIKNITEQIGWLRVAAREDLLKAEPDDRDALVAHGGQRSLLASRRLEENIRSAEKARKKARKKGGGARRRSTDKRKVKS